MLTNKKITIVAETNVEGEKIASYGAILDVNTLELSMSARYIDKEACKVHRDTIREDLKEFEDYVYNLQDMLKGTVEEEVPDEGYGPVEGTDPGVVEEEAPVIEE